MTRTRVVRNSAKRLQVPKGSYVRLAWQLLDDYNAWRAHCTAIIEKRARHKLNDFLPTDERLELFTQVISWCRERELDPRLWLFVLFRTRRWFWPPKLEASALLSEKLVGQYKCTGKLDAYRRYVVPRSRLNGFDPNVDLSSTNEARKAHYIETGQALRCVSEMIESTLGFHPKSEVCGRCPVAIECTDRLRRWADFDILALRLGNLSPEQAQAQAREARGS